MNSYRTKLVEIPNNAQRMWTRTDVSISCAKRTRHTIRSKVNKASANSSYGGGKIVKLTGKTRPRRFHAANTNLCAGIGSPVSSRSQQSAHSCSPTMEQNRLANWSTGFEGGEVREPGLVERQRRGLVFEFGYFWKRKIDRKKRWVNNQIGKLVLWWWQEREKSWLSDIIKTLNPEFISFGRVHASRNSKKTTTKLSIVT